MRVLAEKRLGKRMDIAQNNSAVQYFERFGQAGMRHASATLPA
jgi:hypothetical protein